MQRRVQPTLTLSQAEQAEWDVVVVGAGVVGLALLGTVFTTPVRSRAEATGEEQPRVSPCQA